MKPSPISVATLVVFLFLAPALLAQSPDSANQNAASPAPSASAAEVPRLIKFSGTLLDAQDLPMAGPVGVTFALHAQQTGGAALWMESQNVTPDAHGNYTVLLGANSTNGVPAELFASGEARWLEVQVERQAEQPRVLLVSVPYALKAEDAQTLGGKPASAYALSGPAVALVAGTTGTSAPATSTGGTPQPAAACTSLTSDGTATANFISKFTTACNLQNSAMMETGGNVGIGTTTPLKAIDIEGNNAGMLIGGPGTHNLQLTGATSSGRLGQDLSGFFFASDTNGKVIKFLTNNGALNEWMRITSAGNVGIGTITPAQKLSVAGMLESTSGGYKFPDGTIQTTASSGGGGTITGVTTAAGSGLTGGGTSGTLSLAVDTTVARTNAMNTFTGNQNVTGNISDTGNLSVTGTLTGTSANLSANNTTNVLGVVQSGTTGTAVGVTTTSGTGIDVTTNAGNGIVVDTQAGLGIDVITNTGTGIGVTTSAPSPGDGISVNNNGTGNGIDVTASSGNGIHVNTTGGGIGISVFPGNSTTSTGTGIFVNTPGTGTGITVLKPLLGMGSGIFVNNVVLVAPMTIGAGILVNNGGDSIAASNVATGAAVYGQTNSSTIATEAIHGVALFDTNFVAGVRGSAKGLTTETVGVLGISDSSIGIGILGSAIGQSTRSLTLNATPTGVWGDTNGPGTGVLGTADVGDAIEGFNNSNTVATLVAANATTSGTGLVLQTFGDSFGGMCTIDVNGNLKCTGSKSAVVPVDGGSHKVALYAVEAPENWFEDAGSGQLSNGAAIVTLEPTFAQTVNTGMDYHVFLTPNGDCKGLFVTQKTPASFVVRELGGGASNIAFDFRIMARRKGYEDIRLADMSGQFQDKSPANSSRTAALNSAMLIQRYDAESETPAQPVVLPMPVRPVVLPTPTRPAVLPTPARPAAGVGKPTRNPQPPTKTPPK